MSNAPTSPGDGYAQGPDPAELGLFCPATASDAGTFGLQVAIAPDGRRAVLAYTSLDDLLAGCGPQATWVQLTALGLHRLVQERDEVDTVWLDPARPVAGAPAT
ncbi:MAG TPA: SAV_915 family protein [Motilibacteraceae bacterium]|nr:SAV_915 family protein [Motilibacteraceae bacterium]